MDPSSSTSGELRTAPPTNVRPRSWPSVPRVTSAPAFMPTTRSRVGESDGVAATNPRRADQRFVPSRLSAVTPVELETYRIARVESATSVVLSEAYRGETDPRVRYSVGAKLEGPPWEVRIPTSLVYLEQKSAPLPKYE